MNVLVLGGTGMAGHVVALYLIEKKYEITVFSRKKNKYFKTIIGDAKNYEKIGKLIIEKL